jgi:hypothetical protein
VNGNGARTLRATDSSDPPLSDVQHLTLAVAHDGNVEPPWRLALRQNYPNPFHPSTLIEYDLPEWTHVTVEITNVLGQRVRTLVDCEQPAGPCVVEWDGRSDEGRELASGVYLCLVRANGRVDVKKVMLLK